MLLCFHFMGSRYYEHKLIKQNSIELRDYQINLANEAKDKNSLIVLPTGLGKTTIALQILANILSQNKGGILLLAPTRVLVNQHFDGTLNYFHPLAFFADTSDNESYNFKEMLQQEDLSLIHI